MVILTKTDFSATSQEGGPYTIIASQDSIQGQATVTIQEQEQPQSLVGYWTFNEGVGQTASDFSINGNNGVIFGATWVTGKVGSSALSFDGSSNYVNLGNSTTFDVANISVGAWVNFRNTSANRYIIGKEQSGSPYGWKLRINGNGKLDFALAVGSTPYLTEAPVPSANVWHHIMGTYDGETSRLYVDGLEVASNPNPSGNLFVNTTDVNIGRSTSFGRYIDGLIDDVRIYDRGLSAEEILALYQQGTQPKTPNLTLTKSALVNGQPASEAALGDIITYTIAYQNIGTGDAKNVIITDPIPQGTTYVAGSADATGGSFDGTQVVWNIGEVKAGGSGSVGFQVRVE